MEYYNYISGKQLYVDAALRPAARTVNLNQSKNIQGGIMKTISTVLLFFMFFIFPAIGTAEESILKRKTYEMSAGTDDAEENLANGAVYLSEEHLELCYHYWNGGGRSQIIGLRFPKFDLPVNVVIDSAYLQFFSKSTETGNANLTITGELSVNSVPFSSTPYNISSRPKTAASVTWAVPEWTGWGQQGLNQRSPDISAVVKEIVAQSGFTSASPVTLFLQGTGTRLAQSFDTDQFTAARLLVNYRFPTATVNAAPYKDRYASMFPVGTSMAVDQLGELQTLAGNNIFNHFTAEYEMKWNLIHPEYNVFAFDKADALANYARANKMKLTGHSLLWHAANPEWLFQKGPDGSVSPAVLSARLKNHIDKLVQRYGDVVDNWDVANEVISESSDVNKIYRDGAEGSQWWNVFGSPEFVKLAFQYAAESNAKYGYSSELFYNDFDVPNPTKLNKILKLIDYLKAGGVQIDGIGLQGHWQLNSYPVSQIKAAFDKIIAKGLKIKISELDISIYNDFTKDYAAPLTAAAEQEQAYRYQEIFELLRAYKEHIQSVTFWGISDKDSWLNYDRQTWDLLPRDQWDFPLLFDENFNPKQAFYAILDFAGSSTPLNNQEPVAVLSANVTSGNAPLAVSFDGSGSYDEDGNIVDYKWFFGDGGDGSGASATRTYKTAGAYTAKLTVKDDAGSTATESVVITVGPNLSKVILVQDISMSLVESKSQTAAQAVVQVVDALGNPVGGVTVYGMWSSGLVSGNVSGVTNSNGFVTFTSSSTKKKGAVTFTVNSMSKAGYQYDSCQNQKTSSSINLN